MNVIPLGDALFDVRTGPFGSLLHKADYVQGGVPLVNPMHIVGEEIIADPSYSISPQKVTELSRYVLKTGHIVMGRRGEMGRCAVVRETHGKMICGTGSMILIPNSAILDADYAVRLLRTPKARQFLENAASGVTMLNLNPSAVKDFPIPLPPLDEQKRIAAILDQADALRRLRARALDRLNALGQAIFHEMFGDPRTNPKVWQTAKLASLGELERGISKHRPRNDPRLLGGTHPLIQTGDVSRAGDFILTHSATYSDFGLQQSRKWRKGTLCITIAANIADTAILGFDACFPDSVVGFDAGSEAMNFFVHRWFATVKSHLEQIAPAVAQKNINLAILRELPVIQPPSNLIAEFYDRERGLAAQYDQAKLAAKKLDHLFSSLQGRAFTGTL